MPSFSSRKSLKFTITLGTGVFASSEVNTVVLEGFRASAQIERSGTQGAHLSAKIFGVSQSDMNSITTLIFRTANVADVLYLQNTIEVVAIDGLRETLVFAGNIVTAWADYSGMPDVCLVINSQAAYFDQLRTTSPVSFSGSIDVATVMAQLARAMGKTFENNGVDIQLSDLYLVNSPMEQARDLAKQAGIVLIEDNGVLAIMPPNTPRGSLIPKISPQSGIIGYPTFDGAGVIVQVLFNPAITFFGRFELITDQVRAAGVWYATSISHNLESEKPDGMWFSTIRGNFEQTPNIRS
jgi:hypothetical protein